MKRITYVGTAVLVDDDFGALLLEYAAALARDGTSETIAFRGVNEHDLREHEVSFIVGPASEIVVEQLPEDTPAVDPDNADMIGHMKERIAALEGRRSPGRHSITPEPSSDPSPLVDGLDI
ncbi:hypothetical protein ACFFGH_11290 [Lysobacter korlensis]|uniref:Uncharacterized protein n=1 Tax=Lysobacter korlensis TaxID=553636 RepID=A0ABV6RN60_9GAMM